MLQNLQKIQIGLLSLFHILFIECLSMLDSFVGKCYDYIDYQIYIEKKNQSKGQHLRKSKQLEWQSSFYDIDRKDKEGIIFKPSVCTQRGKS